MSYKQMTGNIISATKVEPVGTSEAGAASGVWNLDDQYDYKRGANWPEAGVPDPDTLIENNFSTFLYDGTGAAQSITNDINLSGKGGMIWFKNRTLAEDPMFIDTLRGGTADIYPNETNAVDEDGNVSSFNSNGFTFAGNGRQNVDTYKYVSWTFKQAPKFFDVVTYTGSGSAKTVAHSLGSTVGMILIKNLGQTDNWAVYHRGADASAPEDKYLILNTDAAVADSAAWWNDTAPTTSVFTVGTDHAVNADGENYVAYVFAHETGDDSMIQCGSYAGNGNTTGPVINLGWEPQWLLVKKYDDSDNWHIFDSMRGISTGSNDIVLYPNTNATEASTTYASLTATGFSIDTSAGALNQNNQNFIYVAIRRPNMATITDATEVFAIDLENDAAPYHTAGFPVDFEFYRPTGATYSYYSGSRLLGPFELELNDDAAVGGASSVVFDYMTGFKSSADGSSNVLAWMWKRAKGFFDVVAYLGTGSAKTEAHGLGAAPEMMWVKRRNAAEDWTVWAGFGNDKYLNLNDNADINSDSVTTIWNNTAPTSTVFSVGTHNRTNADTHTYIAYLFATLAGISKVGSVTHSGSSTDVNCGFSAGARFVLLKRTDANGDWYFWDSVRGIIAGNDPYLLINTTAAQVTNTDFIDPLASGFTITGDFTDGDYLFYAIA